MGGVREVRRSLRKKIVKIQYFILVATIFVLCGLTVYIYFGKPNQVYQDIDKIKVNNGNGIVSEDDKVLETYNVDELKNIYAIHDSEIKETANNESRVIGILLKGESVKIIEEVNNDWVKVWYNDREAYIEKSSITYDVDSIK